MKLYRVLQAELRSLSFILNGFDLVIGGGNEM